MLPLKIGKLYSCSGYYLLIYPDKETAVAADAPAASPVTAAAYWSKRFAKPVSYCNPKTPLLVLSVKEQYIEVLAEDKKGWINYQDWLDIKELVDEAA